MHTRTSSPHSAPSATDDSRLGRDMGVDISLKDPYRVYYANTENVTVGYTEIYFIFLHLVMLYMLIYIYIKIIELHRLC